ncbi:radical SAM protein [Streptomyces sp. NPDC059349]|uniref:radical SAM protein n=1 Tax=Streptomyces sp. NPDC059349 TaxID=3346808 RepID=UPI0036A27528
MSESTYAPASVSDSILSLDRRASSKDGSAKSVWRLRDGNLVESLSFDLDPASFGEVEASTWGAAPVLTPTGHTVCVSSQAGCNVGCRFCATGLQPMKRNLSAEEIVEQVHHTRRIEERTTPTRVIFAGMGEPLLNPDEVLRAIDLLERDPDVENVSVSTMGVVPALRRLTREAPPIDLFLSLHATTDEVRTKLIPLNKTYRIADVLSAGAEFAKTHGRMVDISYLLFDGVNDSDEDADRLAALLDPTLFQVQLLLWNDVPGLPFSRIDEGVARRFSARLISNGVSTYITPSKARDIDAGCGQMITDEAKQHRLERAQKAMLPLV